VSDEINRLKPSRFSERYYVLTALRNHIERIIEEHMPAGAGTLVVDFGCGDMPYRPLFVRNRARYVGVDLPENTSADLHASLGDILPFADEIADVVLSTQVLEHVPEPHAYLKEALRILRPGGLVILSTHGNWMYHPHPNDFWRWTGPGLRKIIADAGFQLVECRGIMGLAATGVHLLQDGVVIRFSPLMRTLIAPFSQGLIALADRISSDTDRENDASVFVVVARK